MKPTISPSRTSGTTTAPLCSTIEPLEPRIAPAGIMTLTDVDGDLITIKTSKGTSSDLAAMGVVVTSTPSGSVQNGVQIDSINLTNVLFDGTDISVTAKRGPTGGNGLVNVLRINATGNDLGTVTIGGDLQEIDAGKTGGSIAGINVVSTSGTRVSDILGSVVKLSVKTDFRGMEMHIDDPGATLGLLSIGHSLIGESPIRTGFLRVMNGTITKLTIGGDIVGGPTNDSSGAILAKNILNATVGGNILGGAGPNGAKITATASLGTLLVKGDVVGGTGMNSGLIHGDATLGSVTINGSLIGGSGQHSGTIEGTTGIGKVKIGHDQRGGSSNDTGDIQSSGGGIASVTVGGSVIGGTASFSSRILAQGGNIGPVKIGGDLVSISRDSAGNILTDSGVIFGVIGALGDGSKSNIASVTIGGSVVGGGINTSNQITADGTLGPVKIGRDLRGGEGTGSGGIMGYNGLTSITVSGSVIGGGGSGSGTIQAANGLLGPVKIGGSVLGGAGTFSGEIVGSASATSITIGGDLAAGSGAFSGISVTGTAGAIKIGRGIIGNATSRATISVDSTAGTQLTLKSLTVGGRVELADISAGGSSNGDAQIGAVKVGGDWIASNLTTGIDDGADNVFGTADDVAVAGGMGTQFSKIASITIGGKVSGTPGTGTTDHFGFVSQEIGSLKINGQAVPLTLGHGTDLSVTNSQFILGTTLSTINAQVIRDVTVHEVA